MPNFSIVERDYTKIYDKYVTLGPLLEKGKVGHTALVLALKKNTKS